MQLFSFLGNQFTKKLIKIIWILLLLDFFYYNFKYYLIMYVIAHWDNSFKELFYYDTYNNRPIETIIRVQTETHQPCASQQVFRAYEIYHLILINTPGGSHVKLQFQCSRQSFILLCPFVSYLIKKGTILLLYFNPFISLILQGLRPVLICKP